MLWLHYSTFRVALSCVLTAFYAMFLYLVHYWVANFTVMLRKWEAFSVPSYCLYCAFCSVFYRYALLTTGRLSDYSFSHHSNLITALFLHCLFFFQTPASV